MKPILLLEGSWCRVECAIRKNGKSESKAFLDDLPIPDRAKILKVVKRYANFGVIHNKEQFRKVEGDIWEFKGSRIRVFMYHRGEGSIALTHGFMKKTRKTPRTQVERAFRIKNEYESIRKAYEQ